MCEGRRWRFGESADLVLESADEVDGSGIELICGIGLGCGEGGEGVSELDGAPEELALAGDVELWWNTADSRGASGVGGGFGGDGGSCGSAGGGQRGGCGRGFGAGIRRCLGTLRLMDRDGCGL